VHPTADAIPVKLESASEQKRDGLLSVRVEDSPGLVVESFNTTIFFCYSVYGIGIAVVKGDTLIRLL
jgi:hypothetical protein